jgi:lipopolysaccharide transport system permease protein
MSADVSHTWAVLEPRRGRWSLGLREVIRYRELLYMLAWRDVSVRYKQTALGVAWALLQPLLTMLVFTIFFGRFAGLAGRTGGVPYPLYVLAGLLPWTFFATSITNAASSLVTSASLVSKVYFPRLLVPLACVGVALVDLAVSVLLLLALMAWYGVAPTLQVLAAPVALLGALLGAAGVGAFLSALAVSYRDVRYAVPFAVQIWMFVTPVIYPASVVPDRWRALLWLNPMAGILEGFRASLLGLPVDWTLLGASVAACALLFVAGSAYFESVERRFADVL